jgi:hypothetical protein
MSTRHEVVTVSAMPVAVWILLLIAVLELHRLAVSHFSPAVASVYIFLPALASSLIALLVTATGLVASPRGQRRGWRLATGVAVGSLIGWLAADHLFFDALLKAPRGRYALRALHATTWSTQHSEDRFEALEAGMTRDQVIARMGSPIRTFANDGKETQVYSDLGKYRGLADKGYFQRWIELEDGGVVRCIKRFVLAWQPVVEVRAR